MLVLLLAILVEAVLGVLGILVEAVLGLADIVLEMWSVERFVEDFLPLDMLSVLL